MVKHGNLLPEVRERAVRLVLEQTEAHGTE
jgi:hypothetical protein